MYNQHLNRQWLSYKLQHKHWHKCTVWANFFDAHPTHCGFPSFKTIFSPDLKQSGKYCGMWARKNTAFLPNVFHTFRKISFNRQGWWWIFRNDFQPPGPKGIFQNVWKSFDWMAVPFCEWNHLQMRHSSLVSWHYIFIWFAIFFFRASKVIIIVWLLKHTQEKHYFRYSKYLHFSICLFHSIFRQIFHGTNYFSNVHEKCVFPLQFEIYNLNWPPCDIHSR